MASFEKLIQKIGFPKDKKFAPDDSYGLGYWSLYREALGFTLSRRKKLGVPAEDKQRFKALLKAAGAPKDAIVIAGGAVVVEGWPELGDVECDALLTNKSLTVWPTDAAFDFLIEMQNRKIVGYKEREAGLAVVWTEITFTDNQGKKEKLPNSNVTFIPWISSDKQENRRSFSLIISLVAVAEEQALKRERARR